MYVTTDTNAEPSNATTPVEIKGVLGSVSFDGQWVIITKRGFGPTMKGKRKLHKSQITGIKVKPATRLYYGYIQFSVRGTSPAPEVKFGLASGRPHREDPDSMSFPRRANTAI